MDSSELGTCSASATASALSPVRHGKGSWSSSSARDHPWIIYLGLPVQHYILVTPATQGLNPNAHVFESKLPTSSASDCSATSWEESGGEVELGQSSSSLTIDPHPQLGAAMAGYHQDHQQQQHHHSRTHDRHHRQQQPRYSNGDMNKLTGSGDTASPCASTSAEQKPLLERPPVSTSPCPTSEDMPYHVAAPEPLPMAEGDCEVIGALADQQQQASPQPQHNSDTFIPQDQLKAMLQQQLEYYFSRENLANDTYLISQMDSDQYVPIWTVANFNQIKKLTKDLTLIVEVLRDSPNVQVDEAGEKVRPNHKRCIVILREIPDSTPVEDVEALFKGENCPKFVSCEFAHNNSWYVTFESDEDAQRAYRYLREEVKFFQGKSIMARIKAKPITRASFLPKNGYRPSSAVDPGTTYAQPRYAAFQPAAAIPSVSYSSQQVPALYAFPPFYPPNMLQTWAPTSHAYFDIGSVFSINGLAPQPAFKPLNGTGRSNYQLLRPRNPKSHLRNQSNYERLDSRSGAIHGMGGSLPTNGFGSCAKVGGKSSGADNGHAKQRDPVGCGGVAALATPSSPGVPHGAEAVQSPASSTGAESREDAGSQASGSAVFNHADAQTSTAAVQPPRSRHRRRKKEEESAGTSRNEVSKSTVPTKDTKLPLPKFDLEAAAFPPLPGTMDGGGCDAEAFENRMSDVVRGTAKPPTRDSKTQTSAPLSPVAHVAEKEVCVVTNGDDSLDHGFTPPPSPTCPRAAEAVSATDTTTRTDAATTERKERMNEREAEVEDEPRSPPVGESIKISIPTSPMPTSSKCSPAIPRSPTVNVSPNVPAAVASGKSPNSISQECKTARLSYAQMAQRAKEKVEKMAQEQKERQGALERERKQKERDVTNMATNVKPGPNSHVKDARNLRDRDAVAKGGQRDRYPLDNREQRYRRTNKMAKDPVAPNPAANQNSDDRERRWERDFSSKLTNF